MGPSESYQGRALSPQTPRSAPTPEEILAQLALIVKSRTFARSERICRFLRFIVEQALRGEDLKEYRVGIEVFDRGADYDPRVDPIVRVEARRLRGKLKTYYTSTGKNCPVLIELPKGAYVPAFRSRTSRAAGRAVAEHTLAILPFVDLSGADELLASGLAGEVSLLLSQFHSLRLVSSYSTAELRGEDPRLAGQRLGVEMVLKGSVRRSADRVRVTAELIHARTGAVLWSEAFSRGSSKFVPLEEGLARSIADALRIPLGTSSLPRHLRMTRNAECYNLCLEGRFHASKRTFAGLRQAAECYEGAIGHDPECAAAHAGAAETYALFADYGIANPMEIIPRAEAAAERALELDPQNADAVTSLALIRNLYHWRWDEAEALYRRAIELNPNHAKARHWFGTDHLMMRGRFAEALEQVQIARMLDPLSMIIHEGAAYIRIFERNFDAAIAALRQMIDMDSRFSKAHGTLARAFSLCGRYAEAIEEFDKTLVLAGPTPPLVAAIGHTKALTGDRAAGHAALVELDRMSKSGWVSAAAYGIVHMGLGDTARAVGYFEQAAEHRGFQVASFGRHPLYDPVRQSPRFQEILKRAGFDGLIA